MAALEEAPEVELKIFTGRVVGTGEESWDAERADKAKQVVFQAAEPGGASRRITRCPRCRCCVYTMPCCYYCAPDNMLNREVLMEQ